jgi:hypothetical protein
MVSLPGAALNPGEETIGVLTRRLLGRRTLTFSLASSVVRPAIWVVRPCVVCCSVAMKACEESRIEQAETDGEPPWCQYRDQFMIWQGCSPPLRPPQRIPAR